MNATINTAGAPAFGEPARTLAETLIDLTARLARVCARPPRWPGAVAPDAPASCAFFLISAASVLWVDAAEAHPDIRAIDVSLEASGAFAAIEAGVATGRPQLVICGSGPGTLGPLWAIPAAKAQGASLLVLVPRTPSHLAGAHDIQESSYFNSLHTVGSELYDAVFPLSDVAEMARVAVRLRHLLARPQGAVVQLSVPTNMLGLPCPPLPDIGAIEIAAAAPSPRAIARVVELLSGPGGPPAFVLGSGSLAHRDAIVPVLERWGAVHVTTPAATGIIPGSLGVIGNAAAGDVPQRLRDLDVRCIVVLGSRLGTASGGGDVRLFPDDCPVVHVDVDPEVAAGNSLATRSRAVLAVTSEIGEFLAALQRTGQPAVSEMSTKE